VLRNARPDGSLLGKGRGAGSAKCSWEKRHQDTVIWKYGRNVGSRRVGPNRQFSQFKDSY